MSTLIFYISKAIFLFKTIVSTCFNKSRSEPGNAPRIGIGHRGSCKIQLQITKLWAGHDFLQGHAVTLTFKVATQM